VLSSRELSATLTIASLLLSSSRFSISPQAASPSRGVASHKPRASTADARRMSRGWSLPRAYAPPGESPDTITRSNQAGLIAGASTNVRKHISVFTQSPRSPATAHQAPTRSATHCPRHGALGHLQLRREDSVIYILCRGPRLVG
jgi:hypothetical protein